MKKFFFLLFIAIVAVLSFSLTSCEKNELEDTPASVSEVDELNITQNNDDVGLLQTRSNRLSHNTQYLSDRLPLVYFPLSSNNQTINGKCGYHNGGVIMSSIIKLLSNKVIIRIMKQNNQPFSGSGYVYIKSGSVCGPIVGNREPYTTLHKYVDIEVPLEFKNGIIHLYAITISDGGYRAYASPITIFTDPIYTSPNTYRYGDILGEVDGVKVFCNGNRNNISMNNQYQCTEFCLRYYEKVYGLHWNHYRYAGKWYPDTRFFKELNRHPNGSVLPRPGDILCMSGGIPYDGVQYGHVAIIIDVKDTYIKIAHQNSGKNWHAIGAKLNFNSATNIIESPSNYTVQGILRPKNIY